MLGREEDQYDRGTMELMLLAELATKKKEKEVAEQKARETETNTIASYEAYLAKYPKGGNAAKAKKAIQALQILAKNEQEEAKRRAKLNEERAIWEKARNENTESAYQAYIDKFPKGAYVASARAAIQKLKSDLKQQELAAKKTEASPIQEKPQKKEKVQASAPVKAKPVFFNRNVILASGVFGVLLLFLLVNYFFSNQAVFEPFKKSESITDSQGNTYTTGVAPNGKRWMTQNLNLAVDDSYCYDDETSNCEKYGRLYTWEAAKTACVQLGNDWRLPTDVEWREMAKQYGGADDDAEDDGKSAYKALVKGGDTGFAALLGGGRDSDGSYYRRGRGRLLLE